MVRGNGAVARRLSMLIGARQPNLDDCATYFGDASEAPFFPTAIRNSCATSPPPKIATELKTSQSLEILRSAVVLRCFRWRGTQIANQPGRTGGDVRPRTNHRDDTRNMIDGLDRAAIGIQLSQRRHQVVAHNLAYMDTPGFRREFVTVGNEPAEDGTFDTNVIRHGRDFTPGVMEMTGRKLDVAIDGDGFFVLDGPDGNELYTRSGVFFVGENGQLVAGNGLPVQGTAGPINIPPGTTPSSIEISIDGSLQVNGNPFGQLRVAAFADNNVLQPAGTALFVSPDVQPEASDAAVRQGIRERSNVSPVHELTRMIIGLRQHEAAQKSITTIAESLAQRTREQ